MNTSTGPRRSTGNFSTRQCQALRLRSCSRLGVSHRGSFTEDAVVQRPGSRALGSVGKMITADAAMPAPPGLQRKTAPDLDTAARPFAALEPTEESSIEGGIFVRRVCFYDSSQSFLVQLPVDELNVVGPMATRCFVSRDALRLLAGETQFQQVDEVREHHFDSKHEDGNSFLRAAKRTASMLQRSFDSPLDWPVLLDFVQGSSLSGSNELRLRVRLHAGYSALLRRMRVTPAEHQCFWRIACGLQRSRDQLPKPSVQPVSVDGFPSGVEPISVPQRAWLPHQCASFQWMVDREALSDAFVCVSKSRVAWPKSRQESLEAIQVEWKMETAFDAVKGGLLCDPVGSGKTATCIALVAHDAILTTQEISPDSHDVSILPYATLVLCPDNVHHQWLAECAIVARNTVAVFGVASHHEFLDPNFTSRVNAEGGGRPTMVIAPYSAMVGSGVVRTHMLQQQVQASETTVPTGAAAFVWRRIILDEVHEIVNLPCNIAQHSPAVHLLEQLRVLQHERTWGVSGTPEGVFSSLRAMERLALLFGVHFNCHESASRFVEHFARSSTVDLQVPLQEHTVDVSHSPEEHAIYQQAAHSVGVWLHNSIIRRSVALEEWQLRKATELLKLASHFSPGGADSTATSAGERLRVEKQQAAQATASQLEKDGMLFERFCMGVEDPHFQQESADWRCFVEGADMRKVRTEIRKLVSQHGSATTDQLRQHFPDARQCPQCGVGPVTIQGCANLQAHHGEVLRDGGRIQNHCRACGFFSTNADDWPRWDGSVRTNSSQGDVPWYERQVASRLEGGEVHECLGILHRSAQDAQAASNFFEAVWLGLANSNPQECVICLEDFWPRDGAVLRCGHVFHRKCLQSLLTSAGQNHFARCPNCRSGFHKSEIIPLHKESCMKPLDARKSTHGSKLASLLDALWRIRESHADAKVLVFCQWADLEDRVAIALSAAGFVGMARLSEATNIFARTSLLERFQRSANSGDPWVLLMSLDRAASGTHLTAANHVVFVHPMVASSAATEQAYEEQAIGRVRRLGQNHIVHIWRLFVRHTVEEGLMKRRR